MFGFLLSLHVNFQCVASNLWLFFVGLILKPIWYKTWDQMLCYIFLLLCLFGLGIGFLLVVGVWKMGFEAWLLIDPWVWMCVGLLMFIFWLGFWGLYFDRSVVCTLMVLLNLICISFLGVCSSCLCMFFMFVNCEKLIPYFNFVFLLFYLFFLFWEERDIKWV